MGKVKKAMEKHAKAARLHAPKTNRRSHRLTRRGADKLACATIPRDKEAQL